MEKNSTKTTGMAFYHPDGFVPAWKLASAFIGGNGRVATLPDIINARLSTSTSSTERTPGRGECISPQPLGSTWANLVVASASSSWLMALVQCPPSMA